MRFWDSSALVPLLLEEARSGRARDLIQSDSDLMVWWASPVECASAIARRRREGQLTSVGEDAALAFLEALRDAWNEVTPSEVVRTRAQRLLRIHALTTADALQLAAALVWAEHQDVAEFVCADVRLLEAARLEGFALVSL